MRVVSTVRLSVELCVEVVTVAPLPVSLLQVTHNVRAELAIVSQVRALFQQCVIITEHPSAEWSQRMHAL